MSLSLCTLKEGMSYTKQLPEQGLSQVQVLDRIREYQTLSKWLRVVPEQFLELIFLHSVFVAYGAVDLLPCIYGIDYILENKMQSKMHWYVLDCFC